MLATAPQPMASLPATMATITGKRTHPEEEEEDERLPALGPSSASTATAIATALPAAAAVASAEPTATTALPRLFRAFADEDSDSENDKGTASPPPAKKRMLEAPSGEGTTLVSSGTLDWQMVDVDAGEGQGGGDLDDDEEDRYNLLFGTAQQSMLLESERRPVQLTTCSGQTIPLRTRAPRAAVHYEAMVAARSRTKEGRAKRSFYGIDIHTLMDGARQELAEKKEKKGGEKAEGAEAEAEAKRRQTDDPARQSLEERPGCGEAAGKQPSKKRAAMLWTEKYRARSFMDLVGDDYTNRLVLRWLKRWDPLVFPHAARARKANALLLRRRLGGGGLGDGGASQQQSEEEKPHRQILILAGPPGLGKTTLAHVCARQAGYDVLEINASDDRSRDVVNGRIRTSLGTESVKTVEQAATATAATPAKIARPVCVIVDEVDGVVGGSGSSGEGGFVKALIDLVLMDQRNSAAAAAGRSAAGHGGGGGGSSRKKRRGDDFRQMRPLILICNDVYHPSLRPLRQSGLAEIVHVGKPSVETVVARLKSIFEKEGFACEKEAARKLCEAAWGVASGPEARRSTESSAAGDLRGVMVVGEWVARRLRASAEAQTPPQTPALTRFYVEKYVLPDLTYGGGGGDGGSAGGAGARGLGRGGVREIVNRVFQDGAGFAPVAVRAGAGGGPDAAKQFLHEQPKEQMSFAEHHRRHGAQRLAEMIETSGDVDRIMSDVFSEYPHRDYNDDSYLSKPNEAYEWMHFHDICARRVFAQHEWELARYTSQPVLACHQLFASSRRHVPDSGVAGGGGGAIDGGDSAAAPSLFSGPRADFNAREAEKHTRSMLQTIQAKLPPSLLRAFRSEEDVAADFLPYIVRLLSPDVKPVLINVSNGSGGGANGGGNSGTTAVASVRRESEKVLVRRAAEVLAEMGIKLQKGVLENAQLGPGGRPQWVYRMDPDLDMLVSFETAGSAVLSSNAPTRYAVRQVLDQELRKTLALRDSAARQARFEAGRPLGEPDDDGADRGLRDKKAMAKHSRSASGGGLSGKADDAGAKRDFFGRIIVTNNSSAASSKSKTALQECDGNAQRGNGKEDVPAAARVWVTFHEGLNNAVRKPISVDEFMRGL